LQEIAETLVNPVVSAISCTFSGVLFAPLAISHHIFTADICQVGQSPKSQSYQLLIKWIELAQGRNVKQNPSETADIPFKGTLGGNQAAEYMGDFSIGNFNSIKFS
jgi:hypothetical protein